METESEETSSISMSNVGKQVHPTYLNMVIDAIDGMKVMIFYSGTYTIVEHLILCYTQQIVLTFSLKISLLRLFCKKNPLL